MLFCTEMGPRGFGANRNGVRRCGFKHPSFQVRQPRLGMMRWTAPRTASSCQDGRCRNPISKEAVQGQVYSEIGLCHARWARSGEEGLSGSRRRCEWRDRRGAQARTRQACRLFLRASAVRPAFPAQSTARTALAVEPAPDGNIPEAERVHCLDRIDVAQVDQDRRGQHFFDPR
jgi:hypothetical protein